eukprot:scaffold368_cov258-Pinguiococcus_pyrenoidosus.AAC.65
MPSHHAFNLVRNAASMLRGAVGDFAALALHRCEEGVNAPPCDQAAVFRVCASLFGDQCEDLQRPTNVVSVATLPPESGNKYAEGVCLVQVKEVVEVCVLSLVRHGLLHHLQKGREQPRCVLHVTDVGCALVSVLCFEKATSYNVWRELGEQHEPHHRVVQLQVVAGSQGHEVVLHGIQAQPCFRPVEALQKTFLLRIQDDMVPVWSRRGDFRAAETTVKPSTTPRGIALLKCEFRARSHESRLSIARIHCRRNRFRSLQVLQHQRRQYVRKHERKKQRRGLHVRHVLGKDVKHALGEHRFQQGRQERFWIARDAEEEAGVQICELSPQRVKSVVAMLGVLQEPGLQKSLKSLAVVAQRFHRPTRFCVVHV